MAIPNAPSNLSGYWNDNGWVRLDWDDNSSNEDGWYLYEGTTEEDGGLDTSSPFYDYGNPSSTDSHYIEYYYDKEAVESHWAVSAYNTDGESSRTNTVTIWVPLQNAPSDLTVTSGPGEITLDWTKNDTNDTKGEWRIFRAQGSSPTKPDDYTQIGTVSDPTTTTYTDTSAVDSTTYTYFVRRYAGGDTLDTGTATGTADLSTPSGLSLTVQSTSRIDLDWTKNDSNTGGSWEIYRSTDGTLGSLIETLADPTVTSYSDSGLAEATEYYYTVRRVVSGDEADTSQQSALTDPDAPTGLTIGWDEQFANLAWTDNSTGNDGQRVYRSSADSPSFPGDYSEVADIGPDVESHDDAFTGAGTYHYAVTTYTSSDESAPTTAQTTLVEDFATATTELPDAGQPTLGNGVEDEISVEWNDVIDYGEYAIRYRETGATVWNDGPVVGQGTTTATITGLEDGEEYEVQLRTQTEHTEGAWTSSETIVTDFPGATSATVDNVYATEVELSWQDNADNEDGFRVLRARQYDDGWSDFEEIVDLGPNTTTYTDTGAQPDRTYKYKIRAYTEHTTADSGETSAVDTAPLSIPSRNRTKAEGWYVEIDHPNGSTLRPPVVGEPTINPAVNDLPRLTIPVPRNEKWQHSDFDEAAMRVWKDGERQPIERLERRRITEEETELVGIGGVELYERIRKEVRFAEAHATARQLIQNNTSYTTNVDDPSATIDEGQLLQEARDDSDFDALLQDIPETLPIEYEDGTLRPLQSLYFTEAEEHMWDDGIIHEDDLDDGFDLSFSGREATHLSSPAFEFSASLTTEYTIPSGNIAAGMLIRKDAPNRATPGFQLLLDGEVFYEISPAGFLQDSNPIAAWADEQTIDTGDLPAGSHSVEINLPEGPTWQDQYDYYQDVIYVDTADEWMDLPVEIDTFDEQIRVTNGLDEPDGPQDGDHDPILSEGSDYDVDYSDDRIIFYNDFGNVTVEYTANVASLFIDCIAIWDNRYDHNLATDVDADGYMTGPELYPDAVQIETVDATTPFTVVGGAMTAGVSHASGNFALAISNDQGQNWTESTNTAAVSTRFAEGSPQIRGRLTLGRTDETRSTATPTTGHKGTEVDDYNLYGDLDDTPTLTNWTEDGQLRNVLQSMAKERNFVWELRWDPDAEQISFEMCQPGQRTSPENADVASYDLDKQTEDVIEQMTVFGSAQPRRGEEVSVSHGEAVQLEEPDIVERKEAVLDRSQSPTKQYVRGEDYEMNYLDGSIEALANGELDDGQTVEVDYEYRVQGTYPPDDEAPEDPREDTQTIVGLGSARICEQTAFYIVQRSNTPIHEATLRIPKQEVGWNAIDEINPDEIPTAGESLQINEITENEGDLVFRLASRRSTRELVNDIRSSVESVSRRV